ncbi:putative acetyltransferase [Pacificibacter maritimus]|uniref:Putative acetyltransferase n=1 Tax=Pacificibacter maritimus TaxID=762213 RepID=A0A3N4TZE9_9RHOB|nr:GNAT family N-acetyltransferase [Pacificibacter maritimus]RPE63188.1 putative acetyltransferase [Pacificibacter maritimus]
MIIVEQSDPKEPHSSALLADAQAYQAERYAPEHCHALSIDELAAPNVRVFTAREGDTVFGVGAVKIHVAGSFGELKSMYTAPEGRGKGIAAAIMRAIEDIAKAEGLTALKLETGDELAAAVRLYERFGFERCGPFADYEDNGISVFMGKTLA